MLPRKQKQICIMWQDPEEWSPVRLSTLDDARTDYLFSIMFGIPPDSNPQDMRVEYKHEFWEVLERQHCICVGRTPGSTSSRRTS